MMATTVPRGSFATRRTVPPCACTTVSYTHLQEAFENLVKEFNDTRGKDLGIVVTHASQGGVNELAQSVTDAAEAVSYTHLDVYKRQVYGLWKRLGTCLFGFLVPAMVVLALLSLFVAPRGGAVTVGLALVFMIAAAFDVANLRTRFNAWRAARRRAR